MVFQVLLLSEGFILLIALGIFLFHGSAQPGFRTGGFDIPQTASAVRDEIKSIPADFFFNGSSDMGGSFQAVFPKLTLTGTGQVKGVFKASIEDEEGNYYYIREGEKVRGLIVKSINIRQVVLADKSGNKLVLNLAR
jgi:hypothetical protein